MTLQPLLDASPVIQVHALAAVAAFFLGAFVLFRRKGTPAHRFAGRLWAALMVLVAGSSFFIHTIRLWGPWSPIHLLSIATLVSLAYAIFLIRRHNVAAHARVMKALYAGALVVAGIFTLLPGRIMNHVVFGVRPALAGTHAAADAAHGPTAFDIVSNTPLWVWPLLLYLLYVGWSRTGDRIVAPARLVIMPAVIVGLALYNLVSPEPSFGMLLGFACGAAAGAFAGYAIGRRRVAERLGDGMLKIKGDWMPLVLIVAIFAVHYARGVALALHPALARDAAFLLAGATLSGLFAAMMVARTIAALPPGLLRSPRLAA
jgi:uncharacterized membrane protein